MVTLKVKKRLMYTVFAFIFIFGGIEYAVILPTLWLYLHSKYDAPEYMLGLVLAAYSLAALFSAPIIGRISDRFACSKKIFIVCALFELAGSFLYFIEVSQWLCLGSRFVSGLGAASEAVAIAEVSRYTTEKERTAIISYLVAMRQIALLIGPGLNAFLRLANFQIGAFEVTKYTAPGAFMVLSWGILIIIILMLYTEPKLIYTQDVRQMYPAEKTSDYSAVSDGIETEDSRDIEHFEGDLSSTSKSQTESNNKDSKKFEKSDKTNDETDPSQVLYASDPHLNIQEDDFEEQGGFIQSCDDDTPFEFPPLSYHQSRKLEDIDKEAFKSIDLSKESHYGSISSNESAEFKDIQQSPEKEEKVETNVSNLVEDKDHFYDTCHFSSSLDLLISAERIISNSQYVKTLKDNVDCGENSSLVFNDNHFGNNGDDFYSNTPGLNEKSHLLRRSRKAKLSSSQISLLRSSGENSLYIERSTSCLYDPVAMEGKLGFFCNEYIRDEVIAIIYLLFCAMFSQMCVETMVLPLSLKYLDFNELENSLLYCICGVEIIIAFIIVSRLSKRVSDRVMMVFGAMTILASNIWLICFLPNLPAHDRNHNIPIFAVAVFLDVLSLPFLLVCATSLYSKITRKQTQGLSQGLRRGIVGLGTVIAPLWGSSAVNEPYVLLGVLIGLQGLSLTLCAISYKRFKVIPAQSASSDAISKPPEATGRSVTNASPNPASGNHVQDSSTANRSQRIQSSIQHSASYGSIQTSEASSSYRSLGIPTEQLNRSTYQVV